MWGKERSVLWRDGMDGRILDWMGWTQPSVSETDAMKNPVAITPDLATVPNPQPQNSPANPSVANLQQTVTNLQTPTTPSPLSQSQSSPADPSVVTIANPQTPTVVASPQIHTQSMTAPPLSIASPQYQAIPSTIANPQTPTVVASPQIHTQSMTVPPSSIASPQYQATPSTLTVRNQLPLLLILPCRRVALHNLLG